jgi:uncharacterized protein (TIGR02118 family)
MLVVTVLYPNEEGTKFDMGYYLDHHIPLVRRLLTPALKGVTVQQGVSGERAGSPPHYIAICHLLFESSEEYEASFAPHAAEIVADVPKYTDSKPLVQLGKSMM